MKGVKAGRLRHRVEIQKRTVTRDANNQATHTWATHEQRWASVMPISGRELLQNEQLEGRVSHRIRMRYVRGITPADRIRWGTRTFSITSVINVMERDRELEILATEVIE